MSHSALDATTRLGARGRDTRLPPAVVGGLPAIKVRRVTEFIESNLHRELRLDELAAVTHMSPYHFARLFKRATGVSPHRFVVCRRIDAATALLIESTTSIGSIARAVGFRTASHFATTVRRITGRTPSAHRVRRAVAEPPAETPPVVAAGADKTLPILLK